MGSGGGSEDFLSKVVVEGVEDKLCWIDTKDGVFYVKSIYKALQPRSLESFSWLMFWRSCVQPKICLFA